MSSADDGRQAHTTPAIESGVDKKVLLGDPVLDTIMTTVIALGSELWTTKRRMKVLEKLLAEKGVSPENIEAYVPSTEENREWDSDRNRFIEAVYGHLAKPSE